MSADAALPTLKASAPLILLPRLMRREHVAVYITISVSKWDSLQGLPGVPKPVEVIDGVKHWDRHDIDQWIEARKEAQAVRPNKWDRVL